MKRSSLRVTHHTIKNNAGITAKFEIILFNTHSTQGQKQSLDVENDCGIDIPSVVSCLSEEFMQDFNEQFLSWLSVAFYSYGNDVTSDEGDNDPLSDG